jgi:hypothetical protein
MRKKQDLLAVEESKWRQKGKAVWICEGDNNTKFFHKFAGYRNITNSIWEIKDPEGRLVTSIDDISEAGKSFFQAYLRIRRNAPSLKFKKKSISSLNPSQMI